MRFVGRPTAGAYSQTLNLSMNRYDSKLVTDIKDFTITVFNGSTYNEKMFSKNSIINNSLNFAGFDFIVYKTIDNTTSAEELDLINHSSTKNAYFVIITNNGPTSKTLFNQPISTGSTIVFYRSTNTAFAYAYTKI